MHAWRGDGRVQRVETAQRHIGEEEEEFGK